MNKVFSFPSSSLFSFSRWNQFHRCFPYVLYAIFYERQINRKSPFWKRILAGSSRKIFNSRTWIELSSSIFFFLLLLQCAYSQSTLLRTIGMYKTDQGHSTWSTGFEMFRIVSFTIGSVQWWSCGFVWSITDGFIRIESSMVGVEGRDRLEWSFETLSL